MPNVVLDGAAIGVIATAIGGTVQALVKVLQTRGQYRAKASDELVTASKRAGEYATALRAICDLLSPDGDGNPPPPEICARIATLARHALGLPGDGSGPVPLPKPRLRRQPPDETPHADK